MRKIFTAQITQLQWKQLIIINVITLVQNFISSRTNVPYALPLKRDLGFCHPFVHTRILN